MDIHDFLKFRNKFSSSTVMAFPIGLDVGSDPRGEFSHHRLILGNYDGISFPVTFKQESGKKWEDILNTGAVSLYLISDRLKTALEESNLTGWQTYSIRLLDKKGNEVFGYHGFSVIGRCGPINYTKGEIIRRQSYEGGPFQTYYKGLYVGLDKWDGTDFFIPEANFGIIITAKAAGILKKNKFSNIFLKNLADVEIHDSVAKI